MKVQLIFPSQLNKYDFGPGHPFRGTRFKKFREFVNERLKGRFEFVGVRPAEEQELLLVHSRNYINEVKKLAEQAGWLSLDTPLNPSIYNAARLLVSCAITTGRLALEKFVAIGAGGAHHAGSNYGGGFCIFNDVATCAKFMLSKMKRVLILDTDAHAGNGTADIFYSDPAVLFISVHQDPRTLYPGTGFANEIGSGEGKGFTVNVPLPPGAGDWCYDEVLCEIFAPLAREFKPDIIIRNGGSDPHFLDSLTNLGLTLNGLRMITANVRQIAEEIKCKYADLILSGYNEQVLPLAWAALVAGATGIELELSEPPRPGWVDSKEVREKTAEVIQEVKGILSSYWKCF
jgi:acetoin utilization protein AcuC